MKRLNFFNKNIIYGSRAIWYIVFILSLFSILSVYSVEGFVGVRSHLVKLLLGVVILFIIHRIKVEYYSRIGSLIFFCSIACLVFLLLAPDYLIPEHNYLTNARRWLSIPFTNNKLTFQPSDIAKIGVVMYLSRNIIKYKTKINTYKNFFKYLFLPLLIIVTLIIPYNLSTAIIILTLGFVLFYFGHVNIKYLLKSLLYILIFCGFSYSVIKITPKFSESIFPRANEWVDRIDSFTNKNMQENDKNFQANKAKAAMSNCGLLGRGPGKSLHRKILPEAGSDYIYSIIVEEYGLIGGFSLLSVYLFFLFQGNKIYFNINNEYRSLIVIGLTFSIVLQALTHISVNMGLLPVTGQNLPLISTGGTSAIVTCINFGFIIGVTKNIK